MGIGEAEAGRSVNSPWSRVEFQTARAIKRNPVPKSQMNKCIYITKSLKTKKDMPFKPSTKEAETGGSLGFEASLVYVTR